jgi:predicted AlkP superfamily pyrophosphatase or phosphodiesterase
MKKKVILVLLDAFRGDYINMTDTPYLYKLSKESHYYKSLVPSFGFCERTEILVGVNGSESGYFTAFGYDQKLSPYRNFRSVFKILGFIEEKLNSTFFSKVIRRLIWETFKNKEGTFYPARIPLSQLADFCLTEDGPLNLIDNSSASLYKIAQNVYLDATTSLNQYLSGTDESRLEDVINALDDPYDFYPTYISLLDGIGHTCGPSSSKILDSLKYVDKQIESFHSAVLESGHDHVIVLCGDHGMSEVHSSANIKKIFDYLKINKLINKKTTMFLDSTMARFWFEEGDSESEKALEYAINNDLNDLGYFVKKEDYKSYDIPKLKMYGDLIWLCNEGVVLSPDYFSPSNKNILGMHGYIPYSHQHYGFCMVLDGSQKKRYYENQEPLAKVYQELKNHFLN